MTTKAYAAQSAKSPLAPFSFERREPLPTDVQIEILYCGVCHSDLHQARNEWGDFATIYPWCPATRSSAASRKSGKDVKKFKEGDLAARRLHGGFVPHLRELQGGPGAVLPAASRPSPTTAPDKHSGGVTFGGYSDRIVVDEAFVAEGLGQGSISPPPRRCCAPASPPIRRCATGRSARDRRSASSASAASGTWA